MIKDFFLPTASNKYYPLSLQPHFLYTYLVFMVIFNLFAGRFLSDFPASVLAQSTYSGSDIISLANQDRLGVGLTSLTENQLLDNAASAKATDMLKYQYWAHDNPTTGATPWSFIVASGYSYHFAGENLAQGFTTAADVNTAWMNSPEHKANILNSNYTEIGVAVVDGVLLGGDVTLVVEMFGTPNPVVQPTAIPAAIIQPPTETPTTTSIPLVHIPAYVTSTPTPTLTETTTLSPTFTVIPTQVNKTVKVAYNQTKKAQQPKVVENITTKIEGMKFTNRVNLFVGVFLLIIFALDALYYYRVRNIHKNNRPNSIAHLPLLILLIMMCIMGATGVTI